MNFRGEKTQPLLQAIAVHGAIRRGQPRLGLQVGKVAMKANDGERLKPVVQVMKDFGLWLKARASD